MCAGQFAESSGEISFPEIPAIVLEKVVQYLYYKVRSSHVQPCPVMSSHASPRLASLVAEHICLLPHAPSLSTLVMVIV